MARRIPGLSKEWSEYLTCILLHMSLPLLPILFEAWFTGDYPTASTLTITAAIYAISIGLSSESVAMLGVCIIIGVVFSAVYGQVSASSKEPASVGVIASLSIAFVFLIHAAERYNRHVADCKPFFNFGIERSAS